MFGALTGKSQTPKTVKKGDEANLTMATIETQASEIEGTKFTKMGDILNDN